MDGMSLDLKRAEYVTPRIGDPNRRFFEYGYRTGQSDISALASNSYLLSLQGLSLHNTLAEMDPDEVVIFANEAKEKLKENNDTVEAKLGRIAISNTSVHNQAIIETSHAMLAWPYLTWLGFENNDKGRRARELADELSDDLYGIFGEILDTTLKSDFVIDSQKVGSVNELTVWTLLNRPTIDNATQGITLPSLLPDDYYGSIDSWHYRVSPYRYHLEVRASQTKTGRQPGYGNDTGKIATINAEVIGNRDHTTGIDDFKTASLILQELSAINFTDEQADTLSKCGAKILDILQKHSPWHIIK